MRLLTFNSGIILLGFCILGFVSPKCCVNITVAVLVERSDREIFPFPFERTSGIVDIAIEKSREMLQDTATLDLVVVPVKVTTCDAQKWGAAFSEMYHQYKPDVIIGPGESGFCVDLADRGARVWRIPKEHFVQVSVVDHDRGEKTDLHNIDNSKSMALRKNNKKLRTKEDTIAMCTENNGSFSCGENRRCSPSVRVVARMTAAWKIPHITHIGTDKSLADKTEYLMLTRLAYTLNVFARFYIYVFDAFRWTYIANIYDSTNYVSNLVGTNMQKTFEDVAPYLSSYPIPFDQRSTDLEAELTRVLREAASKSRVFIVCSKGDVFRQMVLLARRVDFLVEGEYLFIFHFQVQGDVNIGKYDWQRGDEFDQTIKKVHKARLSEKERMSLRSLPHYQMATFKTGPISKKEARKAYESVFVIRPRRPITEEFFEYENEVKRRAEVNFNYTWEPDDEINIFEIGLVDAFLLYAHVLNETILANEDPRDYSNIMKRMWNRTFPGIGGRTYINSNGDRDTDFTLLDLSPETGEFQAVAQYLGWKTKFEIIDGVQIHWPNNAGPPANVPICGFVGERCLSYSLPNYVIVAIILSAVILIVILVGFFAYRHVRSETAIYSEWWRVKWEDVSLRTVSTAASFYSQKHQIRSKGDERSLSHTTQKAFLQTAGVYKGSKVHIKKLNVKSLTVDRSLLLELKKIQEITCQNLARLIGVCPETNNVCILTEYCSRGNLQDILQNESIQLDSAFKISLVNDIVEGMYYLHSSPISVHGRLTSSRCVIDSKFVLKITGFGLKSIINDNIKGNQHSIDIAILPELLWMAPEHLRLYPHRKCSQAGDLYSFGIILYEMITRNEPYVHESWYRSLEDTLERVKKGGLMPTRPYLEKDEDHEDLVKIAVNCWQENPHERPSFATVRRELKHLGLQKGKLGVQNVLDILLNRMEQYANNLEGLVEERTQQFLEEKRKSEELLHQVLPKSVAEQLLTGQPVHAEAFDSVTVYFSDIVGFTNIAARSSPFQIVDFLNDLYTCFDSIIENFDVYKVETIGDAYMVVSGLPERNGNDHVRQVARMSLEILDSVRNFTIRHQPNTGLKARIGLHSGSVCAGVVGRKMPRYCLFGDTVNTASRMESTGEGMRIHISQDTKDLLDVVGGFISEERGSIEVKGKGLMTTHWLIEEILSPSVTSLTI